MAEAQPDLFAQLVPTCGECAHLGTVPIDSGIRYCHGWMVWRWDWERVDPCPYRDREHCPGHSCACNREAA